MNDPLLPFLTPNSSPFVGGSGQPLSFGSIAGFGSSSASAAPLPAPAPSPVPAVAPVDINVPSSLIDTVNGSITDANQGTGIFGSLGKTFLKDGGGLDLGAIGDLAGTIGGFGQLFLAADANKTAKDTLAFQKQAFAENLGNQKKSYNTALRDRARTRAIQNNEDPSTARKYFNKNKL